jgi:hypothetical protein
MRCCCVAQRSFENVNLYDPTAQHLRLGAVHKLCLQEEVGSWVVKKCKLL